MGPFDCSWPAFRNRLPDHSALNIQRKVGKRQKHFPKAQKASLIRNTALGLSREQPKAKDIANCKENRNKTSFRLARCLIYATHSTGTVEEVGRNKVSLPVSFARLLRLSFPDLYRGYFVIPKVLLGQETFLPVLCGSIAMHLPFPQMWNSHRERQTERQRDRETQAEKAQ